MIRPSESAAWAWTRSGATTFTTRCTPSSPATGAATSRDFGRVADVGKAITAGFVYDGQHAPHRRRRHGASAAGDAGDRFVSFIQNHDQVANAYQGQRIAQVAGLARQKVAATVLFSTPALPLLFQGEE